MTASQAADHFRARSPVPVPYEELRTACEMATAELEQAVEVYRALVPLQPEAFRQRLGGILVNFAGIVFALGDQEKAHSLLTEGVEVWRSAAEQDPGLVRLLAQSQTALTRFLARTTQHAEAATSAQEAVDSWRASGDVEKLGEALLVLSDSLAIIGERSAALAAAEEALATLQHGVEEDRLPSDSPQITRAQFAVVELLDRLGHHAEAVTAVRETVERQRRLATSASVRDVAGTVAALYSTEARILGNLGKHDEALAPAERAVALLRSLPKSRGNDVNLAKSLVNYSRAAMRLDDGRVALNASDEAITLLRRHIVDGREESEVELAVALWAYVDVRGTVQVTMEDIHAALSALVELTTIYTGLRTTDEVRFGRDARAVQRHAMKFLQALSDEPQYHPLLESQEVARLREILSRDAD